MTTSGMRAAASQDAEAWGLFGAGSPLAFTMADLIIGDADGARSPASAAYPAVDAAGEVQMDRGESIRQTFHGFGLLPRRQVTHPQDLAVDWHPANLEVGERNGKVPVTVVLTNRRLVLSAEKFKLPRRSRFSVADLATDFLLRRMEVFRWAAHVLLESVTRIEAEGEQFRVESALRTAGLDAAFRLDVRSSQAQLLATEMAQALKDRWCDYMLPDALARLTREAPLELPFTAPVVRALGTRVARPSADARARIRGLPEEIEAVPASATSAREAPNERTPGHAPAPAPAPPPAAGAFDLDWPPQQP